MRTPAHSWVVWRSVRLEQPALKNNTADVERLERGLSRMMDGVSVRISPILWHELPRTLRASDFHVKVSLRWEAGCWCVLDVLPVDAPVRNYGVALDLGTTTICGCLLDLDTGASLCETTVDNPQIRVGADILTRIHFATGSGGLSVLRELALEGVNGAVRKLCAKAGVGVQEVRVASLAGNTTMTHFLLGLDPSNIRKEPYIPVVNRPGWMDADRVGLEAHREGKVFVFPNVGSYFGGDVVSGIVASGMHRTTGVSLLVDVGTNAEVVLGNSDWLLGCAGAAGPALEGGVARMGMTAGPGAVDHVRVDPDTWESSVSVMGGGKPAGICGSGLIDLVAELFQAGVIDPRGKIQSMDHPRIVQTDAGGAFVVVPGEDAEHGQAIVLTQVDLDVLLRSKAAMYAILTTLLEEVGLTFQDLSGFFVAGTFGTYIDPVMAIRLGMLPDLPLDTYVSLGNSSLAGTRAFLLNRQCLDEVVDVTDRITYLELNVNPRFMSVFSAAKFIPHTDPSLFPSVRGHSGR